VLGRPASSGYQRDVDSHRANDAPSSHVRDQQAPLHLRLAARLHPPRGPLPLRQWLLHQLLGAVYRTISGYLLKATGLARATGHTGAVTLIQRFGSALNLNVHFHMIFLDGVYLPAGDSPPGFRHVPAPTSAELQELVQQIAERIGRILEKRGLIERDMENAWLTTDGPGGALDDLIGHSITYRIAVGPRAGQKLFTLQTLPASAVPEAEQQGGHRGAAQAGGFSLHDRPLQPADPQVDQATRVTMAQAFAIAKASCVPA
jgi:hypothetical protein